MDYNSFLKTFDINFAKMIDIVEQGVSIMTTGVFSRLQIRIGALVLAGGLVFATQGALAAPASGCDPNVLKAMQAKAQAQVAYDVAVTEEIVNKPDSVLAMTCFNQAAGVSAADGGAIFSGDFTAGLTPVVGDALSDLYNYFGDSLGMDSGSVDYTATALGGPYNCDEMDQLWTAVEGQGINTSVPFATFNDLVTGTSPAGAGTDFAANWTSSSGEFTALNTAMSALPTLMVPSFAASNTSCDVLVTAGVIPGPCP